MIKFQSGKKYITISEAAEILEVSTGRVSQFIVKKQLEPALVVGRSKLLLKDDVVLFARTRSRRPGPVPKKH